jgi:hypothetical protein
MTNTLFTYNPTLMSSRTAKYVEAMIREGDNFNYDKWLKTVRQEEAEAKQIEATGTSGELGRAAISRPMRTPDKLHGRPNPPLPLIPKTIRVPRTLRRPPDRQAQSQTPEARLTRWLEKVHRASGECQANRTRDAVYQYLAAVFAIVMHYKVRRRTTRLLRHAFKFADRPFNKNADLFTAVIRCTCGNTVDTKTISKYARALRYASWRKDPDMRLKTFMKEAGGLNTCATLYAKAARPKQLGGCNLRRTR